MKNTVVLIKPRPYSKGSHEDNTIPAYMPLSLLAIAAPLIKEGYQVVVFDEKFDSDIEGKMSLLREDTIAVGITAQTGYEIVGGLRISKYAKEVLGLPTIWGGWHASTNPKQTAEDPFVDYVVKGQGLQTMVDLVGAIKNDLPAFDIQGLAFKNNGHIHETKNRKLVDINQYPMPAYHIVDLEKYIDDCCEKGVRITNNIHFKKERILLYSSSYGCPFKCGYCANNYVYGNSSVALKAEAVGEQLEYLVKKYDIQLVQFIDPNFFLNIRRVTDICHEILKRNLNIKYAIGGPRVDQVMKWDDSVLPLLRESGCIWLGVGSESGSQNVLNYMRKGIESSDIMKAARKIHKSGIDMTFFFMFGLPIDESEEDLMASFKLATQLKELYPKILLPMYFYDPYPGTPLYKDALKRGLKEPKSLEEWGKFKPEVTEKHPLVTYVSKKYVDMVKRVIIFYLPLAYPADMVLGTLTYIKSRMKNGKYKYLLKLLNKLAKFRVKSEWYSFPFEWMMFKLIQRIKPGLFYKR
ncbi:MAG: B12-binding domain-containing radical SAM protein [Desulfobaccales bacterium]